MSQNKDFLDDSGLSTLITQMQARFAMLRKGLPGGVAELNSSGKIPIAQESADDTLSTSSTNPVQNGVVTTEINNVKQALSDEVETRATLGAHNFLPIKASEIKAANTGGQWTGNSFELNGITYTLTVDSDDNVSAIAVSGTSTGAFSFKIFNDVLMGRKNSLSKGTFILDLGISLVNTNVSFYWNVYNNGSVVKQLVNTTNEKTQFTNDYSDYNQSELGFYIASGKTVPSTTLVPMIVVASDEYTGFTPFAPTNSQLLSYKDNGVLGAKNLLPNAASAEVKNGVTFTVNADMSITISTGSGGATANSIIGINTAYKPPKGTYKLSSGILDNKFYLTMDAYNGNTWVKGIGNTASGDAVFTVDYVGYDTIRVYVAVLSGGVYTTPKTAYPMIRLASDTDPTYQPYAMTNKELTDALNGFKLIRIEGSAPSTTDSYETILIDSFLGSVPKWFTVLAAEKHQSGNNIWYEIPTDAATNEYVQKACVDAGNHIRVRFTDITNYDKYRALIMYY